MGEQQEEGKETRLSLQTALKAANALLQPPAPLPAAPSALQERLKTSSDLLPQAWKQTRPAWSSDTEQIGAGDDSAEDSSKERRSRDLLLRVVGQRCLDILSEMQLWLEKEFWPEAARGGLAQKDFLLGTADLRLIRLMTSHAVISLLLPLSVDYTSSLSSGTASTGDDRLKKVLSAILELLQPPNLPLQVSGPSSNPILPYTVISQSILANHLSPILLSVILLAYTPTSPPMVHADLRKQLVQLLDNMSPTTALSALGGVLSFSAAGKKGIVRGWSKPWPIYVESAANSLMTRQLQRPGGVKGVIENIFGEAGSPKTSGTATEEQRLELVANALTRIPKNLSARIWIPKILENLFDLIKPASSGANAAPKQFLHAASYTVYKLWVDQPDLTRPWLEEKLIQPLIPESSTISTGTAEEKLLLSSDHAEQILQSLYQLVAFAPPSQAYPEFLISPILWPLFELYAVQQADRKPNNTTKPSIQKSSRGKQAQTVNEEKSLLIGILSAWVRGVDKAIALGGLWSLVMNGTTHQDGARRTTWKRQNEGYALVAETKKDDSRSMPVLSSADIDDDAQMLELLAQLQVGPNISALVSLLKDLDKPTITSSLFIKLLNAWRASGAQIQSEGRELATKSLIYVQLVIGMMDVFGENLLSKPADILTFIEGVLSDGKSETKDADSAPKVKVLGDQEHEIPREMTEDDIEGMSIMDTSLRLLLASEASLKTLSTNERKVLIPIVSHLRSISADHPSSETRQLANEPLTLVNSLLNAVPGKRVQIVQDKFDEALAFSKDKILPVRAHGLLLMADLSSHKDYDQALTTRILEALANAIQDKESFIYLQAVKSLARMVDILGKEVFEKLLELYRQGYSRPREKAQSRLDEALRYGEALDQVIRRSGKAFTAYAGIIVPVLSWMFPNVRLATVLRSSALSLLSTCAEVDHLSLLPWSQKLFSAAVDLLQVESVSSSPFRTAPPAQAEIQPRRPRKVVLVEDEAPLEEAKPAESDEVKPPRVVDIEPTKSEDSKHPALRRAALVFLGLLVASMIEAELDEHETERKLDSTEFRMRLPVQKPQHETPRPSKSIDLSVKELESAKNILIYVHQTDEDETARGQAGEVAALVERLSTMSAGQQLGLRLP